MIELALLLNAVCALGFLSTRSARRQEHQWPQRLWNFVMGAGGAWFVGVLLSNLFFETAPHLGIWTSAILGSLIGAFYTFRDWNRKHGGPPEL